MKTIFTQSLRISVVPVKITNWGKNILWVLPYMGMNCPIETLHLFLVELTFWERKFENPQKRCSCSGCAKIIFFFFLWFGILKLLIFHIILVCIYTRFKLFYHMKDCGLEVFDIRFFFKYHVYEFCNEICVIKYLVTENRLEVCQRRLWWEEIEKLYKLLS